MGKVTNCALKLPLKSIFKPEQFPIILPYKYLMVDLHDHCGYSETTGASNSFCVAVFSTNIHK